MNPLKFLYETVDIIKDGKNGKVSLVCDKVGRQFYIMKEHDLKAAEIYRRLKNIKSPYLPEIYQAVEHNGKVFIAEEFIHRDIKPSNIMITKTDAVKLIDFGIARIVKENRETDTNFLGTRGYAPPEQYGFGQTDSRSDIYSLGVTIQKILGENYNGYLKNIWAKCTELNPAKRYQSAEEIISDIDKKFFRHKFKNAAVKLSLICAVIFLILIGVQKFLDSKKIEVKIWLNTNDNTPLFAFWNGENFGNKKCRHLFD